MSIDMFVAFHSGNDPYKWRPLEGLATDGAIVYRVSPEEMHAKAAQPVRGHLPTLCVLEGNCNAKGMADTPWLNLTINKNWRYIFFSGTPAVDQVLEARFGTRSNVKVVEHGLQVALARKWLDDLAALQSGLAGPSPNGGDPSIRPQASAAAAAPPRRFVAPKKVLS
jgi:hypothetical protein